MTANEFAHLLSLAVADGSAESSFLQAVVIAAGTALTGAVTYLFKQVMYLSRKQTALALEIGELKGRQEGIQELSSEVLNTVHNAINKKDA